MGCAGIKERKIIQSFNKNSVPLYPGQFVKNLPESIYSLYTIKGEIGSGSFGRVVSAIHKATNQSRAIKIINKFAIKNDETRAKIMNEVDILKRLDHPNIVKIYEFHEDEFNLYLVMDLYTGGEVLEAILKAGTLEESQAADFMKQILSTIVYLHNLNIVHRDMKLENMLIEHSQSNNIKIIDFGTATYFTEKKPLSHRTGTINYMAPEVLKQKYTEKCDVWSCGVILYVLLAGKLPFYNKKKSETLRQIQSGRYSLKDAVWEMVSIEAKTLIKKMLDTNPSTRLSAVEAYNDPWIQQNSARPTFQKNLLEFVSANIKSFHETTKLQRAVIRFIATQLLTSVEKNELTAIFQSLDFAATGKISEKNLSIFWKKIIGEELSAEEIHKIMTRIDTDNSGFIEYSEFLVAAMDKKKLLSLEHLDAVFQAFDNDSNGRISAKELQSILDSEQSLDLSIYGNLIKEVDLNHDGFVDLKEFRNMMASLAI